MAMPEKITQEELDNLAMEKYQKPFDKLCSMRQNTISTLAKCRRKYGNK